MNEIEATLKSLDEHDRAMDIMIRITAQDMANEGLDPRVREMFTYYFGIYRYMQSQVQLAKATIEEEVVFITNVERDMSS